MEVLLIISIIVLCVSIGIGFFIYRLLFVFNKFLIEWKFLFDKSESERLSNLRQELVYYFILSNKPKLRIGNLILAFKNQYNFVEIFDELEKLKQDGLIHYPFPRVRDSDSIIEIYLDKLH
jgi:hypothetical protein